MILMPIYRFNTAGIQICDQDLLEVPCNGFVGVTVLVSLVWVASCCTSFAFNKNDYSKEFGYSTRAVQEDSDVATSPFGNQPSAIKDRDSEGEDSPGQQRRYTKEQVPHMPVRVTADFDRDGNRQQRLIDMHEQ